MSAPGNSQSVQVTAPKRGLLSRLSTGHLFMILAGLLAALLNFTLLQQREEVFSVVVTSRPILPGQTVEIDDFTFAQIRAEQDLLGTLVMADAVSVLGGEVSIRSIPAGHVVSPADFRPAAAPLDQRAMSIRVDQDKAVNGALGANDVVDIILVNDGVASYVAFGVEILAVPTPEEGFASSSNYAVTVVVSDETALRIASAIDVGEIHLVRSTGATLPDVEMFDPNAVEPSDTEESGVGTPAGDGG